MWYIALLHSVRLTLASFYLYDLCFNYSLSSSIAATVSFFVTGVLTTQLVHRDLPAIGPADWSLSATGAKLLALQAIPLSLSVILYALVCENCLVSTTF
jgi:hypothetical protein